MPFGPSKSVIDSHNFMRNFIAKKPFGCSEVASELADLRAAIPILKQTFQEWNFRASFVVN